MLRSVCVDFDRVIHSYTTPWSGTTNIPDPPNKGAFQWLTEMVQHYDVHIFSARCQDVHGVSAIKLWMRKHGLSEEVIAKLQFPLGKQSAILYIDDRAFQFQGRFPTVEEVKAFKPWHPDDAAVEQNRKAVPSTSSEQSVVEDSVEEIVSHMTPGLRARFESALVAARSGAADDPDTASAHVLAYFLRHPTDAHVRLARSLRTTITGAMILQALRHEVLAHLDTEERLDFVGRELVAVASGWDEGQPPTAAPLASYTGGFTTPDGRTYRLSVEHVPT